jgi:hypothetical protein
MSANSTVAVTRKRLMRPSLTMLFLARTDSPGMRL